jgi:glycosyltransferase involved in cell wall biosynthesis
LTSSGLRNFCFLIVGQGAEQAWLKAQMRQAEFPGVLSGESLARAYANMDVFVFPSRTDTYGNVVLEALASGVPAIVTDSGGPRFIVRSGETGFVAKDLEDLTSAWLLAIILVTQLGVAQQSNSTAGRQPLSVEEVVKNLQQKNHERAEALRQFHGTRVYRMQYRGFPSDRDAEMTVNVN